MRPVFCSALLAGVSLVSYGQESTPPASQRPAGSAPAALAPKALSGTPGAASVDTDPGTPAGNPAKPQSPKAPDEKAFVIGAEDVLRVEIWGDPRIAPGPLRVRPDGMIGMALLGEFKAAGKTAEQLGKEIEERLKSGEILKETRVNVNILEINSRRIWIQGEVNKAGPYPLIVPTNVFEALANAGGFKDFANKKKIVIQRGSQMFKFNYNEVVAGKNLEQNITLEPGDHIIVK